MPLITTKLRINECKPLIERILVGLSLERLDSCHMQGDICLLNLSFLVSKFIGLAYLSFLLAYISVLNALLKLSFGKVFWRGGGGGGL